MSRPHRDRPPPADQPVLPLELEAAAPLSPREPRSRSRRRGAAPVQLAFEMATDERNGGGERTPAEASVVLPDRSCARIAEPAVEPLELDVEPLDFDPDPFSEIPGFRPAPAVTQEYVLLPGSLRGRLDLREFTRFLAGLPTVVRDWEGAPEVDDGGVRLRGPEGGAWIYPEASRVRLATDGELAGPVGEDLVALCRWVEGRGGMRLYPAGEITGAGVDRSLDPWDTFCGR